MIPVKKSDDDGRAYGWSFSYKGHHFVNCSPCASRINSIKSFNALKIWKLQHTLYIVSFHFMTLLSGHIASLLTLVSHKFFIYRTNGCRTVINTTRVCTATEACTVRQAPIVWQSCIFTAVSALPASAFSASAAAAAAAVAAGHNTNTMQLATSRQPGTGPFRCRLKSF